MREATSAQEVQTSDYDPEWMTHRMNTLTQLVLRQEQTIASLRQDMVVCLPLHPFGARGNDTGDVRGGRQMAGHEGGDAGQADLLPETRHVQAAANISAPAPERDLPGRCSYGPSSCTELGGRAEALAASTVEPGAAGAGDRQQPEACADRRSADAAGTDAKGGDGGCTTAIQIGKEAYDGGHSRVDPVQICISLRQEG